MLRLLPGALRLVAFCLCLLAVAVAPAAHASPAGDDDGPGIAFLASAVGHGESVDDLMAFVKAARVRDVVIDWAWITLHWDHTDFDKVNEFARRLKAAHVNVAAMYRPRYKSFQADKYKEVKAQVGADGKLPEGCEVLYADADARKWGAQWAVDILTKCPAFDEVVIYNPSQKDKRPATVAARRKDPNYDVECVHKFLAETREAMRKVNRHAKLGLVRPPADSLFKPFRDVVDVDRPYVFVRTGANPDKDMDAALEVMRQTKTAGPALAKAVWGEGERVTDEWLADFIKTARRKKLRYCIWTFDQVFLEGTYDLGSLCKAAGLDLTVIEPILRDLGGKTSLHYPPGEVQKALDAAFKVSYMEVLKVAQKYGQDAIEPLIKVLDDKDRGVTERWQAAGALGQIGSSKALDALLRNSRDDEAMVRWLCADALGNCGKGSEEARKRLKELADSDPATRRDPNTGKDTYFVRETAARALNKLNQPAMHRAEPGVYEKFFDRFHWADTLDEALVTAKQQGRMTVLFVNPFDNGAFDAGYKGAREFAARTRAKADKPPDTDVGFVKERAMLVGLLAEPRNAAFVAQRCVAVRMRLCASHLTEAYGDEPDAATSIGLSDTELRSPAVLMISPDGKVVAHAHDMTIYAPEVFHNIATTALAACNLKAPEPLRQAQDAVADKASSANYLALLNAELDAGEFDTFRKLADSAPHKVATEAKLLGAEADLLEGDPQAALDRLHKLRVRKDELRVRANAITAEALVRLGRADEADGLYEDALRPKLETGAWLRRLRFFDALARDRLGKPEGRVTLSIMDDDPTNPWCVRASLYGETKGPNPEEWCHYGQLDLPDVLHSTETGRNDNGAKTATGDLQGPVRKAAQYLLDRQRPDGSWEAPVVGAPSSDGRSFSDGNEIARTSLCACALHEALPLLDKKLGERAKDAIERGCQFVRAWNRNPKESIFDVTYALYLELYFFDGLDTKARKPARDRVLKLVQVLREMEHNGAWTYMGKTSKRLHTFNTAPVMLDFVMARERKLVDVDDMLGRASKWIESQRVGDLAVFHYGTEMHHLTSNKHPRGGSMRSPLCEIALIRAGNDDERKERLGESVKRFFDHLDDVRSTAKRWESFFSPEAGHDAYHYYFGTWYGSQAILMLADKDKLKADCHKLARAVLLTQEIDGGFCDAQIPDGRNAATAMAMMTLVNCHAGG